jgi:predicted ATPase
MLDRFETIRKVGLFQDYAHAPGRELGNVTLIYGENGVGKSVTVHALVNDGAGW